MLFVGNLMSVEMPQLRCCNHSTQLGYIRLNAIYPVAYDFILNIVKNTIIPKHEWPPVKME